METSYILAGSLFKWNVPSCSEGFFTSPFSSLSVVDSTHTHSSVEMLLIPEKCPVNDVNKPKQEKEKTSFLIHKANVLTWLIKCAFESYVGSRLYLASLFNLMLQDQPLRRYVRTCASTILRAKQVLKGFSIHFYKSWNHLDYWTVAYVRLHLFQIWFIAYE